MMTRDKTIVEWQSAVERAQELTADINHLLQWGELADDERDRLTRAHNASEIATCRLLDKHRDVAVVADLL